MITITIYPKAQLIAIHSPSHHPPFHAVTETPSTCLRKDETKPGRQAQMMMVDHGHHHHFPHVFWLITHHTLSWHPSIHSFISSMLRLINIIIITQAPPRARSSWERGGKVGHRSVSINRSRSRYMYVCVCIILALIDWPCPIWFWGRLDIITSKHGTRTDGPCPGYIHTPPIYVIMATQP